MDEKSGHSLRRETSSPDSSALIWWLLLFGRAAEPLSERLFFRHEGSGFLLGTGSAFLCWSGCECDLVKWRGVRGGRWKLVEERGGRDGGVVSCDMSCDVPVGFERSLLLWLHFSIFLTDSIHLFPKEGEPDNIHVIKSLMTFKDYTYIFLALSY